MLADLASADWAETEAERTVRGHLDTNDDFIKTILMDQRSRKIRNKLIAV